MSFEDFYPEDPWLKYRSRDGSFKVWLHTFRMRYEDKLWLELPPEIRNPSHPSHTGRITFVEYWSPLPWIWDEAPDGKILEAMKGVGYLNKCPMGWPNWTKPAKGPLMVYFALLDNINDGARDSWLDELRKAHSNESYFVEYLNENFCLFNHPKEMFK